MFILSKKFKFEASHKLKRHDGKCANLHGHSWVLTVKVRGETLTEFGAKSGMLIDYGTISEIVRPYLTAKLDHRHLNDNFHPDHPTSEVIAMMVFKYLEDRLPGLYRVGIQETETSEVEFGHE